MNRTREELVLFHTEGTLALRYLLDAAKMCGITWCAFRSGGDFRCLKASKARWRIANGARLVREAFEESDPREKLKVWLTKEAFEIK